jgi:hypothetical protein
MKSKGLFRLALLFAFVLVSYGVANSQIVDAAKDAADKTKKVTVKTVDKTADVVTDVADKTKDATVDAAKETSSGVKTFGNYTVKVTENVVAETKKDGKWLMTTTWDGAKWVSKKVWYPNKKDNKEEDK